MRGSLLSPTSDFWIKEGIGLLRDLKMRFNAEQLDALKQKQLPIEMAINCNFLNLKVHLSVRSGKWIAHFAFRKMRKSA
jgi:hypothetical protein